MFDNKVYFKIKTSNEKSFGYVFSIFFFLLGSYFLYFKSTLLISVFLCSLIVLIITLFLPKILIYPNKIWLKIGSLIHSAISPIIMLIIFIIAFFPIGFFIKIFKIDLININIKIEENTYWKERINKMESLKKLF